MREKRPIHTFLSGIFAKSKHRPEFGLRSLISLHVSLNRTCLWLISYQGMFRINSVLIHIIVRTTEYWITSSRLNTNGYNIIKEYMLGIWGLKIFIRRSMTLFLLVDTVCVHHFIFCLYAHACCLACKATCKYICRYATPVHTWLHHPMCK